MRKLRVFLSRLFGASFRRMFRNIGLVHQEFGKSRICIFFDMIYCMICYGTGYLDYMTFGFAGIKKEKRRTFLTMNDNLYLDTKLNNPENRDDIEDKLIFNRNFHDYLNRDFLDLKNASLQEFTDFCRDRKSFFAKKLDDYGGQGVRKVELTETMDLEDLLESLRNDQLLLAEETILQHGDLSRLCASSINTLRIVTLTDDAGVPHCAYVLLRIGNGKNHVDNVSSGGMYTWVSEDGCLHFPAFCDNTASYYKVHPVTGAEIIGFRVPCYQEAVSLCLSAAKRIPQMRYIGWDVAISPDGPCLVEGNVFPGYDMPQNHMFHPDGCGLRPVFEKILGIKLNNTKL